MLVCVCATGFFLPEIFKWGHVRGVMLTSLSKYWLTFLVSRYEMDTSSGPVMYFKKNNLQMSIFHVIQPCFTQTSGKTDKSVEARMTSRLWQVHIRLLKEGHWKGNYFKSDFYVSFCPSVNDNLWSSLFVHPESCQTISHVISLAKFSIKPSHRRWGPSNFSRKACQN